MRLLFLKSWRTLLLGSVLIMAPSAFGTELATKATSTTAQTLPVFSRVYDPKRDPIADGIAALKIHDCSPVYWATTVSRLF